jgi:hypothetical protein
MSVNSYNQASTVNSLKGELTVIDALELTELTKVDAEIDGELTQRRGSKGPTPSSRNGPLSYSP